MIFGFSESDFFSLVLYGLLVNFIFSILFGLLLNNNIPIPKMIKLAQSYKQPWWMPLTLIIPFAKMVLILYRVYILQVYFINQGKSYDDFVVYMFKQGNQKK
jgi:succinate dehydrogenase hydrophobic anchor subunit